MAAASFVPHISLFQRLWLNIQKVSCPHYHAQIFLSSFPERKLWRRGCWQKFLTFHNFCLLHMTDPCLKLQGPFWLCFLPQEAQGNIPIIFSFVKTNQRLPSVSVNRDVNMDYIKLFRTYTTYAYFLFSLAIISQTQQVLSACLTPAQS